MGTGEKKKGSRRRLLLLFVDRKAQHSFLCVCFSRQAVIAFQNVIIMSPQGPYSTTYLEINKNEKKTIGPPTDRGMSLLSRADKLIQVFFRSALVF